MIYLILLTFQFGAHLLVYLGYATKNDIRLDQQAINRIRRFWHKVKYGENFDLPRCAFVHSQLVENGETKVRAIWEYPATITFGEAVFALPLIEAYQKVTTPLAYGYETAVGGAAKIIKEAYGQYHYSLDFESFETVPEWLIRIAFDILTINIDFARYRDWGIADARRSYHMFLCLVDYFINTNNKIRLCSGERFIKRSGVASGSYFTQLIDSIVKYILINWVVFRLRTGARPKYCKVLGDDSIFSTDRLNLIHIDDIVKEIGMKLNL